MNIFLKPRPFISFFLAIYFHFMIFINVNTSSKVCFNCRTPGHKMSACPFISEAHKQGTCFKCGSTEHTSSACKIKLPRGK